MQCYSKDQIFLERSLGLLENNNYWLYINEKIILVKIKSLNPPKDIQYLESEVIINDSKLIIEERDEIRKLNYNERYIFFPFDLTQIDYQNSDLTSIPLVNYASILQILKFKFLQNLYFARAGKIILGINFTNESYLNYDNFSKLNFDFTKEELNNNTFILNGVPNSGKTSLHLNLIYNIINNNNIIRIIKPKEDLLYNEKNSECNQLISKAKPDFYMQFLNKISTFLEFINLFGNCIENEYRFESSRFMRVSRISNSNHSGKVLNKNMLYIKFKHFLLEKSRLLKRNCFLFHIFHAVINGLGNLFTNEAYKTNLLSKFPEYTKSLLETYEEYKHFIINETIVFEEIYFTDSISKYYEEKFILFMNICEEIGFHKKILIKIINIILIILLLKNLEYSEDKDGEAYLNVKSADFQMIIKLMNLESEEEILLFTKKLTTREMSCGVNSVFEIKFKLEEANRIKDNFIKYLYENLFFFVEKISNILLFEFIDSSNYNSAKSDYDIKFSSDGCFINIIGENNNLNYNNNKSITNHEDFFVQIVECFGFENDINPQNNSLENLFVNYANDKINNLFFDQLINNEIKLYEQEGISNNQLKANLGFKNLKSQSENELSEIKKSEPASIIVDEKKRRATINSRKPNTNPITSMDNTEIDKTLNICDDESRGLFRLLDEATFLINNNKGLITSLIDKINNYWPDVKISQNTFFLNHFGSNVEYGAPDFIYKNIENIPNELKFIAKNIFKNLFSLTIKNFKLDKDKNLKLLMKKFYKENIEESIKKDNSVLSNSKGGERLSVTRRISKNTIKARTNSERFLETFKKLLTKIRTTKLKIIKLINTSIPRVESSDYISADEKFLKQNSFNIKSLELLINPILINPFQIFDISNSMQSPDLINYYKSKTDKEANNNLFLELNVFNNLILKHKFYFDDKYVLKQIFSSGIMESIQLAKSGFFIRCDYITLGKKLILYKSFFEDELQFTNEIENWALEKNSDDYNTKVESLLQNWKPEKALIKKISTITNIDENNFILGRKLLFISNKALIENPNLSVCGEFSKLIIKNIFKKIIRKVKNILSIKKNFFSILKKRKIEVLDVAVSKSKIKFSIRKFFSQLSKKSDMIEKAILKIQLKFRKYTVIKNKVKILQKNIRIFLKVNLKAFKLRNFIYKIMHLDNRYSNPFKRLSFNKVKQNANIRYTMGNKINNNVKKFIRRNKIKEFTTNLICVIDRILNLKHKRKGLIYIKSYAENIQKVIKIQNNYRLKKSILLSEFLINERNINKAKENGLKILMKNYDNIEASFKINFLRDLNLLSNLKLSKAQLILKHYTLYSLMKKKLFNLRIGKKFDYCDMLINKNLKINKGFFLKNLNAINEEKKLIHNKSAILIQKLLRLKKSKTVYQALKTNKKKDIERKTILLTNKIESFIAILNEKAESTFLRKMKIQHNEIIKNENMNYAAITIALLFKKFISISKLKRLKEKKKKFVFDTLNLLNISQRLLVFKRKCLFFNNFKKNMEEIIKTINSAIKIQNLFRVVLAKEKFVNYKKEYFRINNIKKNALSKLIYSIEGLINNRNCTVLEILKALAQQRYKSALLIQKSLRKNLSFKHFLNLKLEKEIVINKLKLFMMQIEKTYKKIKIQLVVETLKDIKSYICIKNTYATKIQSFFRRKRSILQAKFLRELITEEAENNKKLRFNQAFILLEKLNKILQLASLQYFIKNIFLKIRNEEKFNKMLKLLDSNYNKENKLAIKETFDILKSYSNMRLMLSILENLCFKTENIIESTKIKNKKLGITCLSSFIEKIRKVIMIQNNIRSKNSSIMHKKLKKEAELQKQEITKQKNILFIERLIKIYESKYIKKCKSILFDYLYINYLNFNETVNHYIKISCINKITKFLRLITQKKKIKMFNLVSLLKRILSISGKENKLLKFYFEQFKRNCKIFGIVQNFIYYLLRINTLKKYLKKKIFKALFDIYINRKISRNILKKSFFKKYRKIKMEEQKKLDLSLLKEFAKVFSSINKNKNCKVKTTQDTFSVLYSNINIVDDYLPENKELANTRLSANPIYNRNLNHAKKANFIEINTNKANQIRFTANLNPLNRKKIATSKEKNSIIKSNNQINIDSKNYAIDNKTNFPENSKSNYTVKGVKENKSKSKSPIPKPIKKNNILDKINNIPVIPLIKNESIENFFSNSNDNNLFDKDISESNFNKFNDLKENEKSHKDDKVTNNSTSTRKSVAKGKQISVNNNNFNKIKNFSNSDSKIQNDLDLLTNELDDLIKDAVNIEKTNKKKNIVKKTNTSVGPIDDEASKGLDYWKLNQEYKRSQLKKIENPLDTKFRNFDNENIFEDLNKQNMDVKLKITENFDGKNYEKLAFKRDCLSDFPKSKQGKK